MNGEISEVKQSRPRLNTKMGDYLATTISFQLGRKIGKLNKFASSVGTSKKNQIDKTASISHIFLFILFPGNPPSDGSYRVGCMYGNGSWLADLFSVAARFVGKWSFAMMFPC